MSIEYENGFLHTSSSYYTGGGVKNAEKANFFSKESTQQRSKMFNKKNIQDDFDKALAHARKREIAFYHLYTDANDYDTFMKEIRAKFQMADHAGDRIRSLSNASLKKNYDFKTKKPRIKFRIEVSKELVDKAQIELTKANTPLAYFEEDAYLDFDNDTHLRTIKGVINHIKKIPDDEYFTRHYDPFNRKHIRRTGKYDIESVARDAVREWLEDEMGPITEIATREIVGGLKVTAIPPSDDEKDGEVEIHPDLEPFTRFTGNRVKDILANGTDEEKKAVKDAINEVKKFLKRRLTLGDDEKGILIDAFNDAWNSLPQDFFFEGDNLIKAVLGNVGEFQKQLFIAYARHACKAYNTKLGKIIGQVAESGRGQSRSDYQIMVELDAPMSTAGSEEEAIGIQVKNVDRYNRIEVNSDLGLVAPNLGEEITTAIANYSFNKDIAAKTGDMKAFLKKYLEEMIWRGLNFNVGDGLDPDNTNTFYWLGGDMIIPVSEIILHLRQNDELKQRGEKLMEAPETTIDLNPGEMGDEQFLNTKEFINYWHGNQYTSWTPASDNHSNFQKFIIGIRIHSALNFASFLNVSGGPKRFSVFNYQ